MTLHSKLWVPCNNVLKYKLENLGMLWKTHMTHSRLPPRSPNRFVFGCRIWGVARSARGTAFGPECRLRWRPLQLPQWWPQDLSKRRLSLGERGARSTPFPNTPPTPSLDPWRGRGSRRGNNHWGDSWLAAEIELPPQGVSFWPQEEPWMVCACSTSPWATACIRSWSAIGELWKYYGHIIWTLGRWRDALPWGSRIKPRNLYSNQPKY